MTSILALGFGVIVVLSLVGIVARLVRLGVGALACLGWLAVSPNPRLFPIAWWLLAAWLLALTFRAARRSCRRPGGENKGCRSLPASDGGPAAAASVKTWRSNPLPSPVDVGHLFGRGTFSYFGGALRCAVTSKPTDTRAAAARNQRPCGRRPAVRDV